ncbi:MAG: molybdopterin molybdotransferase MoeA [Thermoanaerobaculia bacterium]
MIPVADALAIIAAAAKPGEPEAAALCDGVGRVLAAAVVSDVDWPPFDTSAMDGYALRMADVAGKGSRLSERPGTVAAGDAPPAPLETAEAVRVMTGAPLPLGAEAIVPVERVRRQGGHVFFDAAPAPGAHIRRRGESIAAGTPLLAAGRRLRPSDMALAALAGADPLRVFPRPRLAIAVTGNELVAPTLRPGPGQLRDSNGPMLLALAGVHGWPARALPRVPDDASAIERLFASAGETEDVLVTSGGVSAGDLDLLPAAAKRSGFELLFHGVAVSPGKPMVLGRRGRVLWLGLPGNPVSSSVCFHLFVRFALDCLEGDGAPGAPRVTARLMRDLACSSRETYRDAILSTSDAENRAEPIGSAGSHDIAAHARANALIRVPAGAQRLPAGATVECVVMHEASTS